VNREIKTILGVFAPEVVAQATVRQKDGTTSTITLNRDEVVQSTLNSIANLKNYQQRRITIEAGFVDGSSEANCRQINVQSVVIEQGLLNDQPYRLNRERYRLEQRGDEWLAIEASRPALISATQQSAFADCCRDLVTPTNKPVCIIECLWRPVISCTTPAAGRSTACSPIALHTGEQTVIAELLDDTLWQTRERQVLIASGNGLDLAHHAYACSLKIGLFGQCAVALLLYATEAIWLATPPPNHFDQWQRGHSPRRRSRQPANGRCSGTGQPDARRSPRRPLAELPAALSYWRAEHTLALCQSRGWGFPD
jgi:hypothetical protein